MFAQRPSIWDSVLSILKSKNNFHIEYLSTMYTNPFGISKLTKNRFQTNEYILYSSKNNVLKGWKQNNLFLKLKFLYLGGAIGIFVGISFWSIYDDIFGPWIEWFERIFGKKFNNWFQFQYSRVPNKKEDCLRLKILPFYLDPID